MLAKDILIDFHILTMKNKNQYRQKIYKKKVAGNSKKVGCCYRTIILNSIIYYFKWYIIVIFCKKIHIVILSYIKNKNYQSYKKDIIYYFWYKLLVD